jgi:hypothetical protein
MLADESGDAVLGFGRDGLSNNSDIKFILLADS